MREIREGDCIEAMAAMGEATVDAIVTDPPYGLGFMGRKWDALPPGDAFAAQAFRVLKPGGHLLAFGGTRTYHRLACERWQGWGTAPEYAAIARARIAHQAAQPVQTGFDFA